MFCWSGEASSTTESAERGTEAVSFPPDRGGLLYAAREAAVVS